MTLSALENLQSLYDQNRFLEAYRLTAEYWAGPKNLERFSANELIFGARLARRLGGSRLSRWLNLAASEKEPGSPRVRYFASGRRGRTLLDELRDRETHPLLETDDPDLQASWLAGGAVLWASLRDFPRAHDCIERAKTFDSEDGWVFSCESDVFVMEDRLEEALSAAERGWELSLGAPYAAQSLGHSLLKLGCVREAADRLHTVAAECESYEVVISACWQHAALAETLEGKEKTDVILRARALAERLPTLTPLADRETRSVFARIELDLAQLADDRDQMARSAKEVRAPFFSKFLENLQKNPSGLRILLPYRRHLQRHVTCLPTSLATALGAMGTGIDADEMAAEVTYGGTSDWAAAEWLQKRGLEVRGFIVTPELASALVHNGIAFVMSLEADDFAHAVAIVGLDEAAGTLIVHDPTQFRTAEYLLDMFQDLAPLGPHGMVAVSPEKAALVDQLLNPVDVEVISAWMSYHRALQLHGPTIASAFVTQIGLRHPSHPVTRLLQATDAAEDGRAGEALACYQKLLEEFPSYPSVRARLLGACRTMGNVALLRDALESVVERGVVPGVQSQQDWVRPPTGYVCQYADLLRASATTGGRARALVHGVLRRAPASGNAWHVLADVLWHDRNVTDALIAYRLASCLEDSNEHYASAYSVALGVSGRVDEGLAWLEGRVRAHGGASGATGAWIHWMDALMHWGRPEEALAVAEEAIRRHELDPPLLSYVTTFLGRMGRWNEAESLLARLEEAGNPALFHEAAVHVHVLKGDLDEAVRHAEAWVLEHRLSLVARRTLLVRVAARDGARKAFDLAERWRSAHPGHDTFEELSIEYLSFAHEPPWKKALLLRRRLKRNAEDGWAWRELASLYLQDHDASSDTRRARLLPRIAAVIAECDRTAPLEAETLRAKAVWSQQNGRWQEAVEGWLASIDREPGTPNGYRNVWECSATFGAADRLQVWQRAETLLLAYPGRLHAAREVAQLAAQRFGVAFAEEAVTRWKGIRPEDPEITEAAAGLLLEYGHGRTDAERALAMLEPAVKRYPFHVALRFLLLRAQRSLGRFAEAEEVVREIVRRHPSNAAGLIQLAWVHELDGRDDEALRVLETAIGRDPQNAELPNALVEIHLRNGRLDRARGIVEETLARLPTNVFWRERSIQFLLQCGKGDAALDVAREGVVSFPRGAYLWYLLGDALEQVSHLSSQGEIERCFRRSLELNHALFDGADRLAMLLVGQRRFQEAEEVVRSVALRMGDPSAARGRLAWIHREQGDKTAAFEELVETLSAAPWYQWGWAVLMEWIAEDEAWDRARSVLGAVPPEIRTYPRLLKDRLKLLEKAGLGADELDAEWTRLLSDFPEDPVLHLERYDSLRNGKRLPEAAEVLRRIQPLNPDDPFMNARLVEVLAREHKREEALEVLLRVLFAPVERSEWPADFAWHTVLAAGFGDLAFERVHASLKDGFRPTRHALVLWSSRALEISNTYGEKPSSFLRIWFPDAGARKVLAFLEGKQEALWMDGRYRARLLGTLCDFGYDGRVERYWRKHRTEVESDVDSWAQTARALMRLGRNRKARELMATWRERPGVTMWMIGNYAGCFSGVWSKSLSEIRSICSDALSALPHDHSTRYLVHVYAEACALLGDEEAFRTTFDAHRGYFDGELSEGEWFRADRRHLLKDIPALAAILKEDQRLSYRVTLLRLRARNALRDVWSSRPVRFVRDIPFVVWWFAIMLTSALIANL